MSQGVQITASKVHIPFKTELLNTLGGEKFKKRAPRLVGILSTKKEDARTYAEFTKKACEQIGIEFELRFVGEAREGMDGEGVGIDVEEAIIEANDDPSVDGLMVYYPIYSGRQDQYLQSVVSPLKDVEGLNHQFLFNLYHNVRFISPLTLRPAPSSIPMPKDGSAPEGYVKSVLPCTPLAIIKILEHCGVYNKMLNYGDRARGKVITVINRSEVVGRPLAALLANDGARVLSVDLDSIVEFSKRPHTSHPSAPPSPSAPSSAHARSITAPAQSKPTSLKSLTNPHHQTHPLPSPEWDLEACLRISDVVISAVPSDKFKVPTAWIKDGAVCVSVAQEKNFESDVRERAGIYVPSVGMMTIAMLQRNLLRLCSYKDEAQKAIKLASEAPQDSA